MNSLSTMTYNLKVINKILKSELFALFAITILSLLEFYYRDTLADNYLVITSQNSEVTFFSYYIKTIVAFAGYYFGAWLFFPFVIFALFYAFMFSKREYVIDTLNIVLLLSAFLTLTHLAYPPLLGEGLNTILSQNTSALGVIAICIGSFIAYLFGAFRASFRDHLVSTAKILWATPAAVENVFAKANKQQRAIVQTANQSFSSVFKMKIPLFLKWGKSNPAVITTLPSEVKESSAQELTIPRITRTDEIKIPEKTVSEEAVSAEISGKAPTELSLASTSTTINSEKLNKLIRPKSIDYPNLVAGTLGAKREYSVKNPEQEYFDQIITRIEEKLNEFHIDGYIEEVLKGPVVDTFLLELGKGVKVSKITVLTDDISGALYGAPIRIVYPMIGRTSIGIEVPRNPREPIYLDEVLSTKEFKEASSSLPIAIGRDAYGKTFVVDLASMPHMLVAGTTGSGKSVFINTLLVSLLIKKSPLDMKMILIDPKQLELALYSELPHLCMPVVTDSKTASLALMWAVQEMDRRYSILKEFGVRDLDSFNRKLESATPAMLSAIAVHYEDVEERGYHLPYLVIVVDEFADLILTKAGKEVESNICRLAGKARAAGIHLIIATQRPSVDVITGLIKSNFPTRISFKVTTSTDSRTILSAIGAEKLLGKGDMLYKRGVDTVRVHSAYVDENEINALVEKLASLDTNFDDGAMEFLNNGGEKEVDPYAYGSHLVTKDESIDNDELYSSAVEVVLEYRSASASMLQRRLKIGYNRAANLIEKMEAQGVVGPAQGSRPRRVLSSSESHS